MNELKHDMRTGALVKLSGLLQNHSFFAEAVFCSAAKRDYNSLYASLVAVYAGDVGLVVNDLIEEHENDVLVLFNEKILRVDCRVLQKVN